MPSLIFRDADQCAPIPADERVAIPFPHIRLAATYATDIFEALEAVSRRMEDLAREFDCLGYFDDDDGPRAA